jgi:hypothetical protein
VKIEYGSVQAEIGFVQLEVVNAYLEIGFVYLDDVSVDKEVV